MSTTLFLFQSQPLRKYRLLKPHPWLSVWQRYSGSKDKVRESMEQYEISKVRYIIFFLAPTVKL